MSLGETGHESACLSPLLVDSHFQCLIVFPSKIVVDLSFQSLRFCSLVGIYLALPMDGFCPICHVSQEDCIEILEPKI